MVVFSGFSCKENIKNNLNTKIFSTTENYPSTNYIVPGAERLQLYIPQLHAKSVGLVVNHTSRVGQQHLVDTLLQLEVDIKRIFAPEHGFKGEADAGEKVRDGRYKSIEVVSLYGQSRKPSDEDLSDLDVIIFDIQDVGVRFYTYISTMTYVLEAAAQNNVAVIILDRPNPNGFYVDGPILESKYASFIGMHPVPVVYGMTIGEYARMVVGESWIEASKNLELDIVPCNHYDHSMIYRLPVKPSPNLPNIQAILLYPSICYFEGTNLSIGRGTDKQFQVIGHPALTGHRYTFRPMPNDGARHPKLNGELCHGEDLSYISIEELRRPDKIRFNYIFDYYKAMENVDEDFFLDNNFFEKLIGTSSLREALRNGISLEQWRKSWEGDLSNFKKIRKKYLLYSDFE